MHIEEKVGLVLSGGGARGIAHIGVLKALGEMGIRPAIISGSSAGAIIGALHAVGMSCEDMLAFVGHSSLWKFFRPEWSSGGLSNLSYLEKRLLEAGLPPTFEELPMPLYVCASDLTQGRPVYFHSGTLVDKILASCSIPLVFAPVAWEGSFLTDGGVLNNLPASPLRGKVAKILGVNVIPLSDASDKSFRSPIQVAQRCFELFMDVNIRSEASACDFVLSPRVQNFYLFSLPKFQVIHDMGYQETLSQAEPMRIALGT